MSIWKCPKCETLNDDNFCQICGAPRPVAQVVEKPSRESEKSNKGLKIALVIIVSVLFIVLVAFGAYMLLGHDKDEPVAEPAVSSEPVVTETIYYVNKFDDSGIYVREGPGKGYDDILYIKKDDQSVKLLYLGEKELGSDNYFWYLVETPSGKVGYVREDVVEQY